MSWELFAGCVELVGNMTLLVVLASIGFAAWPGRALKLLAGAIGIFSSTNVFYAGAYIGRLTGSWEWWGTPVEGVIYQVQVFSMWALLIAGIGTVVTSYE